MKLTIAIPTYNRSNKLQDTIKKLLLQIISSNHRSNVAVFVSNNGSTDSTINVLEIFEKIFQEHNINFRYNNFKKNEGFDNNVCKCYSECCTDYIWLLSDDDIISDFAVNQIFIDIAKYNPNIIFYNFCQEPYSRYNPYIKENNYFKYFDVNAAKIIINFPKLSVFVFKKILHLDIQFNYNLGFAHITLMLHLFTNNGGLLLSKYFIGEPQNDYKDNIDFVPYIGNNLNLTLLKYLKTSSSDNLYNLLKLPYTNPLSSSLNMLSCYYRGKFYVSNQLKLDLFNTIRDEIANPKFKNIFTLKTIIELFKIIFSIFIHYFRVVLKIIF